MKNRKAICGLSFLVVSLVLSTYTSICADEYTEVKSYLITELSATANAKNGWYSNSSGTKYYYDNGKKVISKTKKIDGKIYLFDEKGILVTGGIC